jgi:hypothetical protein
MLSAVAYMGSFLFGKSLSGTRVVWYPASRLLTEDRLRHWGYGKRARA